MSTEKAETIRIGDQVFCRDTLRVAVAFIYGCQSWDVSTCLGQLVLARWLLNRIDAVAELGEYFRLAVELEDVLEFVAEDSQEVQDWNASIPIGTPVVYRVGSEAEGVYLGRTKAKAVSSEVFGDRVLIDSAKTTISLECIQPASPAQAAAIEADGC